MAQDSWYTLSQSWILFVGVHTIYQSMIGLQYYRINYLVYYKLLVCYNNTCIESDVINYDIKTNLTFSLKLLKISPLSLTMSVYLVSGSGGCVMVYSTMLSIVEHMSPLSL